MWGEMSERNHTYQVSFLKDISICSLTGQQPQSWRQGQRADSKICPVLGVAGFRLPRMFLPHACPCRARCGDSGSENGSLGDSASLVPIKDMNWDTKVGMRTPGSSHVQRSSFTGLWAELLWETKVERSKVPGQTG